LPLGVATSAPKVLNFAFSFTTSAFAFEAACYASRTLCRISASSAGSTCSVNISRLISFTIAVRPQN
jgi:hypothetical protein